jgi:AcrR family transcriptional regulator
MFARDGLVVGLTGIAAQAGVGAGTLHRQFPTKTSLIAAVVARGLRQRV